MITNEQYYNEKRHYSDSALRMFAEWYLMGTYDITKHISKETIERYIKENQLNNEKKNDKEMV